MMTVEQAAFYLVCAVVNAIFWGVVGMVLAGNYRGRAGAGFLWGFLLGPIGMIVVLALADLRPKCKFCRRVINPEARICPHCQREVGPPRDHRYVSNSPVHLEKWPGGDPLEDETAV